MFGLQVELGFTLGFEACPCQYCANVMPILACRPNKFHLIPRRNSVRPMRYETRVVANLLQTRVNRGPKWRWNILAITYFSLFAYWNISMPLAIVEDA